MLDFRFAYLPVLLLFIPMLLLVIRHWMGQSTRCSGGFTAIQIPVSWLDCLPGYGCDYVNYRIFYGQSFGFFWLLLSHVHRLVMGKKLFVARVLDIVMALDISDSMATADFNGLTRFDAAKDVIIDFIQGRSYDRIGLVIFAEDAFYQAPPTTDYNILATLVEDAPLAGAIGLSNRTAIGLGIASSTNLLRRSSSPSQVIILVTDGLE